VRQVQQKGDQVRAEKGVRLVHLKTVVFGPHQPLGLQELCYCIGAHRKWKLKDTPVTCSDTILFASPGLCEIVATRLSRENDLPLSTCAKLLAHLGLPRRKRRKRFAMLVFILLILAYVASLFMATEQFGVREVVTRPIEEIPSSCGTSFFPWARPSLRSLRESLFCYFAIVAPRGFDRA
jgi:hypothetical protein